MEIIATSSCPPNVTSPLSVSGSINEVLTIDNDRGYQVDCVVFSGSLYIQNSPIGSATNVFTSSFINKDGGYLFKQDINNYTLDIGTFFNNITGSLMGITGSTKNNYGPGELHAISGTVDGDVIFGGYVTDTAGGTALTAVKTDGTNADTFMAVFSGSLKSGVSTGAKGISNTNEYLYFSDWSANSKNQRIRLNTPQWDSPWNSNADTDFGYETSARINSSSVVFGGSKISGSYRSLSFLTESGSNWTLDTGPVKFTETALGSADARIWDMEIHSSSIYVCGLFTDYEIGGVNQGDISGYAKLDLDGNLDLVGFSTASSPVYGVTALGVQSDGKIILGTRYTSNAAQQYLLGWDYNNGYENIPGFSLGYYPGQLIRLNADGTFDDTFNYPNISSGYSTDFQIASQSESLVPTGSIVDITILPDDRIVVMGQFATYYDSASLNEVDHLRGMVVLESNGGLISTPVI